MSSFDMMLDDISDLKGENEKLRNALLAWMNCFYSGKMTSNDVDGASARIECLKKSQEIIPGHKPEERQ